MAELCQLKVVAKVVSWPIIGRKLAIFLEIWTTNLFCPPFALILRDQPIWMSVGPKLTILSSKNTKMAISQNVILAKRKLPKYLLLLYFSMNLTGTFRIDVNMDFTNNITQQRIFDLGLQNIFEPKIQKNGQLVNA